MENNRGAALTLILFSKDRACQLDLTLQTLFAHFKEASQVHIKVLYTASSTAYILGYNKVKDLYPTVNFIKEQNFAADTKAIIQGSDRFISFLVDDDIFLEPMSLHDPEYDKFYNDDSIICVSPRIYPGVNFCYTQNAPQPPPQITDGKWEWGGQPGDWGYPFSIAGLHVFRKSDITPVCDFQFRAPNTFEAALTSLRFNRPYMICYPSQKTYTCCNNRVQTENANRHANTDSPESLNSMFLLGKRLEYTHLIQLKSNMCHGPVQYLWK